MPDDAALALSPAPSIILEPSRAQRLLDCEQRIEQGLSALYEIYSEQLYLDAGDTSFDAYLARRWGWKERYARELRNTVLPAFGVILSALGADETVIDGGTRVPILPDGSPAPAFAVQLRQMSGLSDDQIVSSWAAALTASGGSQPTGEQMRAAVQSVTVDPKAERVRLDQERVRTFADVYPYIGVAVLDARLKLTDAVRLIDLLESVKETKRRVWVLVTKAGILDEAMIRFLEDKFGSDSFEELEATGMIQFEDETYVPLAKARLQQLRDWFKERSAAHRQISYDAATATISCWMEVCDISDDPDAPGYMTVRVPVDALARLTAGKIYDVQIRVVERTKEVR